jgi:hypothetical protein
LLGPFDNDDDSTWDPRDDEYSNSNANSFDNYNFNNGGDQDDSDRESLQSADSTDQVKAKPRFNHRDVAVLKSTNGLLCPGDIVSYCLRDSQGEPKSSTIVSLLDSSTPDQKVITHENGVILQPLSTYIKQ